jgi:hypothetical protein
MAESWSKPEFEHPARRISLGSKSIYRRFSIRAGMALDRQITLCSTARQIGIITSCAFIIKKWQSNIREYRGIPPQSSGLRRISIPAEFRFFGILQAQGVKFGAGPHQ